MGHTTHTFPVSPRKKARQRKKGNKEKDLTDRSLVVRRGKRKMGLFSSFFPRKIWGFMAAAASLSSPEPRKKKDLARSKSPPIPTQDKGDSQVSLTKWQSKCIKLGMLNFVFPQKGKGKEGQ